MGNLISGIGSFPVKTDTWTDVECSGGDKTDFPIFTGGAWLLPPTVWKQVDNATFQFKNTAGTALFGSGGMLDYAGSFPIPMVWCPAGLKISTSGFTGGNMTVWWVRNL